MVLIMSIKKSSDTRRSFLERFIELISLIVAGTIVYPIIKFLIPPKSKEPGNNIINVTAVEDLPINSSIIFPIGNKPGILIHTPSGEYKAFTAICTHLDCTVQYRKDYEHIWCACRNGHYDLQGRNISGPPPRPLKEYEVNILSGRIYVNLPSS